MLGIGGWEFFIVAALALLLFGPDKLPEFARTIGRLARDFKRYKDLMESTLRAEIYTTETTKSDPFKKGKEFREKVESGEVPGASAGNEVDEIATADDAPVEAHDAPADEGSVAAKDAPAEEALKEDSTVEREAALPPDHPLSAAYAAGEDIGIDDDLDLSTVDPADLGWVPGHSGPEEEVDEGEG